MLFQHPHNNLAVFDTGHDTGQMHYERVSLRTLWGHQLLETYTPYRL